MILAAHFLAGSLLTLLVPVALLVAVIVWWVVYLRRHTLARYRQPGSARRVEASPGLSDVSGG